MNIEKNIFLASIERQMQRDKYSNNMLKTDIFVTDLLQYKNWGL